MVSPGWGKGFNFSVVSCKSMDSGFNENQSEFAVSVSSELFDMLSDVDSLLDKMVKIFWERWCNSLDLQNSENL